MIKSLVALLLLLAATNANAQSCLPNGDCELIHHSIEVGNGLIVSGEFPNNFQNIDEIPLIYRVDSAGNELWRTIDDLQGHQQTNYI